MKKMLNEFKAFIMRGNVLDMAVGVIIATAFGKITSSLVNDLLMPFIGWIIGSHDMSALNVVVRPAVLDEAGQVVTEAITLGFGTFVGTIIDFILVALVVFLIVKGFNKAHEMAEKKKQAEEAAAPAAAPEPSNEEKLLMEIRDLLKEQK